MAPTGWATKEEREFLISFIPQYETCQIKRRYKAFWQQLNAEFLAKFPVIDKLFPDSKVTDLSPEQKEMYTAAVLRQQQRLKEWFRWQMNPRSRNAGSTITKKDLRTIYSGRTRPRKPYEVFAQLYADEVEEEKESRCEADGISGRRKLNIWQEVSRELYDSASKEQKDAVRKTIDEEENNEDAQTPSQYLRYLKKLPTLLDATISPAVRKAGVLGFFTIVGPDPEQNGKIACKSLQFGDKSDTPVFAQVWEGHDTIYAEELARFARRHEFSPEICMKRSLRPIEPVNTLPNTEDTAIPTCPSNAPSSEPGPTSSSQSPVQTPSQTPGIEADLPIRNAPAIASPESPIPPPTGHSEPNTFIPPPNENSTPHKPDTQSPVSAPNPVNIPLAVPGTPLPNSDIQRQPPSSTPIDRDSTGSSSFSHISRGSSDIGEGDDKGDLDGDQSDSGLDEWNFSQADWEMFDKNIQALQGAGPNTPSTLSAGPYVPFQQLSSRSSGTAQLGVPDFSITSLSPLGPPVSGIVPFSSGANDPPITSPGLLNSSTAYSPFPPSPHGSTLDRSLPSHSSTLRSPALDSMQAVLPPKVPPSLPSYSDPASFPNPQSSPLFPSSLSSGQYSQISLPNQLGLVSNTDMSSLLSNPGGSSLFGSYSPRASLPFLSASPNASAQPPLTLDSHNGQNPQMAHFPNLQFPQPPAPPIISSIPDPVIVSDSGLQSSRIMQRNASPSECQSFPHVKPQRQTAVENGSSDTDRPSTAGVACASTSSETSPHLNISSLSNVESRREGEPTSDISTRAAQTDTVPPCTTSPSPRDTMRAAVPNALAPLPAPNASQSPAVDNSSQPVTALSAPRPSSGDSPQAPEDKESRRRSARGSVPSKRNEQLQLIGTNSTPMSNRDPDGSKAWFTLAEEHLRSFDLGEEWSTLVDLWGSLEASMDYGKGTKHVMSAAGRPDEWQKWKSKVWQGTRRYDKLPEIHSAAELGITFAKWWLSLQPPFRMTTGPFPSPEFSPPRNTSISVDPWAPLRKSGENGFISVMMLLGWWGHAATTTTSQWEDDSRPAWSRLVSDVTGVVKAMTATPPPTAPKRPAAKENIAPRSQPNKRQKRV